MTESLDNNMKKDILIFFRNLIYSAFVLTLAGISVSCKREVPVPENPDELVRMGDISITVQDLEREVQLCKKEGRPFASEQVLLERMVAFNAQAQRARALGLDKDPTVERRIEKILVAALHEKECSEADEKVSEEELKAAYDADIAKYTRSAMDRFAMLYLELEKSSSDGKHAEVRKRMEEARDKSVSQMDQKSAGHATKGFGKLSLTYSDDAVSRYRGGDIGWSRRDMPSQRVPSAVWKIGVVLDKGEMSEILEVSGGLYLIMKTDFRAASVMPYDRVRDSIQRRLVSERREVAERKFTAACIEWATPVMNESRIKQLSGESEAETKVVNAAVPGMGVPNE